MCGIVGVAALPGSAPPSPEQIKRMCDTIVHRGPDGEGLWVSDGVGLGARRLAVIDIEGGDQPITNEDGSIHLVYNGEIYNFRELRKELESVGHRFRTETDGEVVVHLWEEHGPEGLLRINGMFALALHDARRGRLLIARDRLGIKPLYYSLTQGYLVFGSEVKALLASELVPRTLDIEALRDFLAWEYVPAPATLFSGVRKLRAAELLELDVSTGRTDGRIYWDVPGPSPEHPRRSLEEWTERVDAQVERSVRGQLQSDVPLGAFLSGGVDSSLVVSAMGPAQTFSIGFDDPSYNELRWAKEVAAHLGVEHTYEVIRPDVAGLFDHLMHFMDDPIGDFSIFPTYLVSRLARQEVTVALSGDGGDELFGGYDSYLAELTAGWYSMVPSPIRRWGIEPATRMLRPRPKKKGLVNKAKRFLEGFGNRPELAHARWRLFLDTGLESQLFTGDALEAIERPSSSHVSSLFAMAGKRTHMNRCLYVDLKSYLPENCLAKVDRMSMACSLETRVPLLDHELVELAFQIPPTLKVTPRERKLLLKRVAERRVPKASVYRPKEGFSIPIKNWLRTSLKPLMMDLLEPTSIAETGLLDSTVVSRLVDDHLSGTHNHSHVLWSLMVFQDWRRRWGV